MKFTELVNRNQNILKGHSVRKISSAIPVSEERNNFFNGTTFKKYDVVKSEGQEYRILEKCSNYFRLIGTDGAVVRKFAKDLEECTSNTFPPVIELTDETRFHGIRVDDEDLIEECYTAAVKGDRDDVALLRAINGETLTENKMDNSYKPKDKLTVAKIIADALGVPYDVVSSPENLVNQAIRKALHDPAIMRNPQLVTNMLKIAQEVGIKFTAPSFEPKEMKEDITEANHVEIANKHYLSYIEAVKSGNTRKAQEYKRKMEYHRSKVSTVPTNEENESVMNELDIKTVKRYADLAKKSRPPLEKVGKRFAGTERAQDRIHKDELNKIKLKEGIDYKADTICVDVPLMIRIMEYAREDAKTDQALHFAAENMIKLSKGGKTLTMMEYKAIVAGTIKEETVDVEADAVIIPDDTLTYSKFKKLQATRVQAPEPSTDNVDVSLDSSPEPRPEHVPHGASLAPTNNTNRIAKIRKMRGE